MAQQIQHRRGPAAMWMAANPLLVDGELGFETDTCKAKLGNGVDSWNDLPYWPVGEGVPGKTFYDSLSGGSRLYPYTLSRLVNGNQGWAPDVINHWSRFASGWWRVENHTAHTESNHQFAAPQDWVDWKNANVPNDGSYFTEDVIVRPYDIIDDDIPVISRMYGVNSLWSGLVGGGRVKKSSPSCLLNNWNPDSSPCLLRRIWQDLTGFSIGLTDGDFGGGSGGRKTMWTPCNSSRMYAMPKAGEIVDSRSTNSWSGDRHTGIPANWEGFNPLTPAIFTLSSPTVYVTNRAGQYQASFNPANDVGRKAYNKLMLQDAYVAIVAFLVTQNVGVEPEMAVFIKPLGIDTVWLNSFDSGLYTLEVCWEQRDQQKTQFRTVTSFVGGNHPNTGVGLYSSQWRYPSTARYMGALIRPRYADVLTTRFRLRSIATGKVGRPSRAAIKLYLNHTNAPTKYIVE